MRDRGIYEDAKIFICVFADGQRDGYNQPVVSKNGG